LSSNTKQQLKQESELEDGEIQSSDAESFNAKASANCFSFIHSQNVSTKSIKSKNLNKHTQNDQSKSPIRIKISLNTNKKSPYDSNSQMKCSNSPQENIKINIGELVRKSALQLCSSGSEKGLIDNCDVEKKTNDSGMMSENSQLATLVSKSQNEKAFSVTTLDKSLSVDDTSKSMISTEEFVQTQQLDADTNCTALVYANKQLEAFKKFHELNDIQNKRFVEEIKETYEHLISEIKFNSGM